jgi:hypothetical protein
MEELMASGAGARTADGPTVLHTRRFITYHGDRFTDRSVILEDRRGRVKGVFPAAVSPASDEVIFSHPGLTYGGVVHDGTVRGASMIEALQQIAEHYRLLGYRRLRYKAVPAIYHSVPAEDDLYALFRLGGRRYRSDLSATIDLTRRGKPTHGRMSSRKTAEAAAVCTEDNWDAVTEFWAILETNLAQRHGASPVHSLREIRLLHDRFPDEIHLIVARTGGLLAGGGLVFAAGPTLHLQYTATTPEGRAACVTDPLIERAVEFAAERRLQYFDFGISTVEEGRSLDEGLYKFKLSFGAGSVVYDQYELDLE